MNAAAGVMAAFVDCMDPDPNNGLEPPFAGFMGFQQALMLLDEDPELLTLLLLEFKGPEKLANDFWHNGAARRLHERLLEYARIAIGVNPNLPSVGGS